MNVNFKKIASEFQGCIKSLIHLPVFYGRVILVVIIHLAPALGSFVLDV